MRSARHSGVGADLSFQLVLAGRAERDRPPGGAPGALVDQTAAGAGRRLHPRGGVHGVAGDHALTDRAQRDRDLGRDDTRPGRQAGRADLLAELGDPGHELERGPDGTLGVTLPGDRRPPHRHDRVADELLHGAAVPLDEGARLVEVPGEQLTDLLGVPRLRQRRKSDQVAEQDRANPALGHGRRRSVGPDARRSRNAGTCEVRSGSDHRHGSAAIAAESGSWHGRRAARRTDRSQRRAAVGAEPLALRLTARAGRTGHERCPRHDEDRIRRIGRRHAKLGCGRCNAVTGGLAMAKPADVVVR